MPAAEATPKRKPLIMSIDDDQRLLNMVELYLTRNGYDVELVTSGPKALARLKEVKPDLILLDVMMPEMSGNEVCARLQKDPATSYIPVVFVTALGQERNRARAFALGAVDYLVKPFKKINLLNKILANIKSTAHWSELEKAGRAAPPPEPTGDKFQQFLAGLADKLGLDSERAAALAQATRSTIYDVAAGLDIRGQVIARHQAEYLGLPYLEDIYSYDVLLGLLPTPFCRINTVVPLIDDADTLIFAMAHPFDLQLVDTLKSYATRDQPYRLMVTEPVNIRFLFNQAQAQSRGRAR